MSLEECDTGAPGEGGLSELRSRLTRRLGALLVQLEGRVQRGRRAVATGAFLGLCLLCAFSCVGPRSAEIEEPDPEPTRLDGEPTIRVLLVEGRQTAKLTLKGLCAVLTADDRGQPASEAAVAILQSKSGVQIKADGVIVELVGVARYSGGIVLRPKDSGTLVVDGRRFHGDISIRAQDSKLRVINSLSLGNYLAGVIPKEMPLSYPEAALDAQAIAARTYAIYHARRRQSLDHDVKNDTRSQVYGGADAERPRSRAAVVRTRGLVATWKGAIFQTFFHSTCGGQTVPAQWIFDGKQPGALSGADCGRCVKSRYHRWAKSWDREKFVASLRDKGLSIVSPLTAISNDSWNRGGYLKAVVFTHAGGKTRVDARKFRRLMGLRSTSYALSLEGEKVNVKGAGWGHGVGLCQVGAGGFAKEGYTGVEIIEHYYPTAVVRKLY